MQPQLGVPILEGKIYQSNRRGIMEAPYCVVKHFHHSGVTWILWANGKISSVGTWVLKEDMNRGYLKEV